MDVVPHCSNSKVIVKLILCGWTRNHKLELLLLLVKTLLQLCITVIVSIIATSLTAHEHKLFPASLFSRLSPINQGSHQAIRGFFLVFSQLPPSTCSYWELLSVSLYYCTDLTFLCNVPWDNVHTRHDLVSLSKTESNYSPAGRYSEISFYFLSLADFTVGLWMKSWQET